MDGLSGIKPKKAGRSPRFFKESLSQTMVFYTCRSHWAVVKLVQVKYPYTLPLYMYVNAFSLLFVSFFKGRGGLAKMFDNFLTNFMLNTGDLKLL